MTTDVKPVPTYSHKRVCDSIRRTSLHRLSESPDLTPNNLSFVETDESPDLTPDNLSFVETDDSLDLISDISSRRLPESPELSVENSFNSYVRTLQPNPICMEFSRRSNK